MLRIGRDVHATILTTNELIGTTGGRLGSAAVVHAERSRKGAVVIREALATAPVGHLTVGCGRSAVVAGTALAALLGDGRANRVLGGAVIEIVATNTGSRGEVANRLVRIAVVIGSAARLAGVVLREAAMARGTIGVRVAFLAGAKHANGLGDPAVAVGGAFDAAELGVTFGGALLPRYCAIRRCG